MKAHSFGAWFESKAPTCSDKGEEKRECANCEAFETREVKANGHTEVEISAVEPTCTSTGLTAGVKCDECGEILTPQQTVEKKAHSFGDWFETKAPTCSAKGEEKRECANCEAFERREIEKLPHTEEILPGKEASCTETGLTEGIKCTVCEEIIKAQIIIPVIHLDEDDDGICDICGEYSDDRCRCSCHGDSFFAKLIRLIRSLFSVFFGKRVYCCEDMNSSIDIGAIT